MSNNERKNNIDSRKTQGNVRFVGSLFLGITILVLAWIAVVYFHITYIEGYLTSVIKPTSFPLGVTLVAVIGGLILSIPILRNLLRKDATSQVKVQPMVQLGTKRVHPLFMTSRPSRDSNFVIRKTSNRGRISRNRAGERLPPSYQE